MAELSVVNTPQPAPTEGSREEVAVNELDSTYAFMEQVGKALDGDKSAALQALSQADALGQSYIATVLEVVAREGASEGDARSIFESHPTLYSGPGDVRKKLELAVQRRDLVKEDGVYMLSPEARSVEGGGIGALLALGAAAFGVYYLTRRLGIFR